MKKIFEKFVELMKSIGAVGAALGAWKWLFDQILK